MATKSKEYLVDFYGMQISFTRKRGRPPKRIKLSRADYARLKMGMIIEKPTYTVRMVNGNKK